MNFNSVYDNMTSAELKVSDYINQLGLWWQYEQPVFVFDDKQRPRVWTPDFYIPELGMYIEVAGNREWNYEFREKVYELNRIPVIFVSIQSHKWKEDLFVQMHAIHQQRWEKIRATEKRNFIPGLKM